MGSKLLEALTESFADSQLSPDYISWAAKEGGIWEPSLPAFLDAWGTRSRERGNHTLPVASSAFPICGFSDGSLLCWAWTFKAMDRGSQFFCSSTGKPDRSSLPLCCPFLACRWLPSPWILMQQREEALVPSSSYKGTNLTTETPPSFSHRDLITSPTSHLQTPSHWGLGLQYVNFGGGGHLQSRALRSSSWEEPGNFLLLGK